MGISLFDSFLTTPAMIAVFDDAAVVQAMLRFEAALARAQAAEGMIPVAAAQTVAAACEVERYDIEALVQSARHAGSLAIPLIKELTREVSAANPEHAIHVHWGSTSQDVIDTSMVLVTRDALALLEPGLERLIARLLVLAEQHLATPVLARTLMQPAQVSSLGFKFAGWAAPLVRARKQLHAIAQRALQLQLGGAVGTLAVMGEQGAAVAHRVADDLGLVLPVAAWHTQRDEWVRLGLEVAVLVGSLGKIATDLSLMSQGEIAELAEPSGHGRGGSSAMPHKRNPVSSMIALAAAGRTPQRGAALLSNMTQEHERGLGNWQAELAEWPALFFSADGALSALNEAMADLHIDEARMLRNIDSLRGLVFAEAVSAYMASAIGRPQAHALMEKLTRAAVAQDRMLADMVMDTVQAETHLREKLDPVVLRALFDPIAAATPATLLARRQLIELRAALSLQSTTSRDAS